MTEDRTSVDKRQAAYRLIDSAIRMNLEDHDLLATHAIIFSAAEVVRNMAKHRDKVSVLENTQESLFKKGRGSDWKAAYNFLKHADKDPDKSIVELPHKFNDMLIAATIADFNAVFEGVTPSMMLYPWWYAAVYEDDALVPDDRKHIPAQIFPGLFAKSRPKQLHDGLHILTILNNFLPRDPRPLSELTQMMAEQIACLRAGPIRS